MLRGARDRLPDFRWYGQRVGFNASRGFRGGPVARNSRSRVLDSFTYGGGLRVKVLGGGGEVFEAQGAGGTTPDQGDIKCQIALLDFCSMSFI